ncbi:MAG: signal peptide peptidase SppA [Bacteroidales bacterium]
MKQFFKFTFASCLGFAIAMFILWSIMIFSVMGLIATIGSSTDEKKTISDNSILHLNLNGVIQERSTEMELPPVFADYAPKEIGLDRIMKAIENAKNNPKIKGIYLESGLMQCGYATTQQIRSKLQDFKKSGKFVYAYSDMYAQSGYFLATAADTLVTNPSGMIEFKGLSSTSMFFKGAMDKLGIQMQIFKVGTYKSAVEPFTETKMSEANREQMTMLLSNFWNVILDSISVSRGVPAAELNQYASQGIMLKEQKDLLSSKLVDKLQYRDEFNTFLKQQVGISSDKKLKLVSISDMAKSGSMVDDSKKSNNTIALVYAVGEIDGTSTPKVDTRKLAEEIFKIKADSSVKAVVLRVNSPGGSAFGSEQVWHALSELKEVKPFVVSMGDYAASGGYYISCDANWIYAEPTTLTGSIGIFGMLPNTKGLTDKLGLNFDVVQTNPIANFPSLTSPVSTEERMLMQSNVERGYELFTRRCAEGRKMPLDSILKIAEGRVWSGVKAKELGLVDQLGGIDMAVAKAATLANLKGYKVKDYPKKKDFFEQLLEDYGLEAVARVASVFAGDSFKEYMIINNIKNMDPVQARLPLMLDIE